MEIKKSQFTIKDGFVLGIGIFLANLVLGVMAFLVIYLIATSNGYTFYW